MGQVATLTRTGQITVPKWVREVLGVKPGQRIVFRKNKNTVTMEREKTAEEIAREIDALIPDEIREYHMKHYAGLTAEETVDKWLGSEDARAYFREEMERTL